MQLTYRAAGSTHNPGTTSASSESAPPARLHNSTQLDLDLERHLLAPFVPHGLQNTHARVRDDLAIAQADKLTRQTTMKLLVALALAVQVSSSATDGPDKQVQLPGEKPEPPVSDQSACAPVGPPFQDFDGTLICTQFSSVCLVFNKNTCSVKPKGSFTQKDCLDKSDTSEFEAGTTEWCPEATGDIKKARCTNGNQCIIRQDKNGKLIRKQKTNAACDDESAYDCPTYASLRDGCNR